MTFLSRVAEIGHGCARREVIAIVERILPLVVAREQSPLVGGPLLLVPI